MLSILCNLSYCILASLCLRCKLCLGINGHSSTVGSRRLWRIIGQERISTRLRRRVVNWPQAQPPNSPGWQAIHSPWPLSDWSDYCPSIHSRHWDVVRVHGCDSPTVPTTEGETSKDAVVVLGAATVDHLSPPPSSFPPPQRLALLSSAVALDCPWESGLHRWNIVISMYC